MSVCIIDQILYERILSAKTSSLGAEMKRRNLKDSCPSDPYARYGKSARVVLVRIKVLDACLSWLCGLADSCLSSTSCLMELLKMQNLKMHAEISLEITHTYCLRWTN